ncbi:MAG TPA: FGGY family carbohydrate kinase [Candidatus Brocadiia bacterium]|nr:FGGY family carbohydrate kinase [Candidatus Brocadiia bacterium]
MKCLVGVDLGTTAVKAGLFTLDGREIAVADCEYATDTPAPGWAEVPAERYWEAFVKAVRSALKQSGAAGPFEAAAIGFSSQGETFLLLDGRGRPIRPAIAWFDTRAIAENRFIEEHIDRRELYETTGTPGFSPIYTAQKLLWLRNNEPESLERAAHIVLLPDYFIHRLTGEFATDPVNGGSTCYVDIRIRRYWDRMLNLIGAPREKLPDIVSPCSPVGRLRDDIAAELGLAANGAPVVVGANDQIVGALGAGNVAPGIVTEATGSALAVIATTERFALDPGMRVPIGTHVVPGLFYALPFTQSGGIALRWVRDVFGFKDFAELTREAGQAPPGSAGLLALPHVSGSVCPDLNPAARAAFRGISLAHSRGHIARAMMEALAYSLREQIELLAGMGIRTNRVRCIGGGARSDLWLRIKASVLNVPTERPECMEAAALGAAIIGACGAGLFKSPSEAGAALVSVKERFDPEPGLVEIYRSGYKDYIAFYGGLYGRKT